MIHNAECPKICCEIFTARALASLERLGYNTHRIGPGNANDVALYEAAAIGSLCGIVFVAHRLGGEGMAAEPSACTGGFGSKQITMEALDFDKTIEQVVERDRRYHRDAYMFVRDALDYTQKNILRTGKEGLRHVSGQELLEGIRAYALHVYGPMAILVLNEWGLQRCEDFGNIVFNLIESGLFAKTDQDDREHFKGGYLFDEAFKKPFLPNARPDADAQQPSIPASERQSESVDPA